MLLLVEDDEMLGSATAEGLAHAFKVTWVRNVTDAKFALEEVAFDIVLLDLGLPDGSGLGLLRDMRANRHLEPVIILTALDSPAQRIAGLKAGADDYVGKPFDLGELAARCEALIRRARGHAQSAIDFDGLVYDKAEHRLTQDGQEVVLSATELRIFDLLMIMPAASSASRRSRTGCITGPMASKATRSRSMSRACGASWGATASERCAVWATCWAGGHEPRLAAAAGPAGLCPAAGDGDHRPVGGDVLCGLRRDQRCARRADPAGCGGAVPADRA